MRFKYKRVLLILIILFFFLNTLILNSENVNALKLYPGKIEIDFEPNKLIESGVCFIPEGNAHIKILSAGSLEEYITIERDEIYVTEDDNCVMYNISLPASFDRPGKHDHTISGTEIPAGEAGFVIKVKINQLIIVHVPYPGKYLEINQFTAKNAEAGEPIEFTAPITCKGKETINNIKGVIQIFDKDDQLIGTVNTNTVTNLKTTEKETLYAVWDSGDNVQGNYKALLKVTYDGEVSEKKTEFKLGGLDVQLVDYTKKVILGGIQSFYVSVESIWSENIPNARASVIVFDNQSTELTSFETLTKNLPAWNQAILQGYIDTNILGLGTYDAKITLFFA
ncbi:MAG: hypothetical protein KKF46_04810, partial [Nanoarchaeota archaeon]|nr:hypothetical protein [Nanoarchaeota archaeon]